MDFLRDLKQMVEQELNALGIPFSPSANINDLLLLMLNYQFKSIRSLKRAVHTSAEFNTELQKLSQSEQAAAKAIQQKFIRGDDVNGHLGSQGNSPAMAGNVDQLLADWRIYHLHISNHKTNPSDNHYARTGPVMFLYATDADAYFIDIYPHGGWTRQKLLEIVEREWPQVYAKHHIPNAVNPTFIPTDQDIKKLRGKPKRGFPPQNPATNQTTAVNSIVKVGNNFLRPPGGGLATDGTPFVCVFRMNRTVKEVKRLQTWATKNEARLKSSISKQSGVPEAELDFELIALSPKGFGVRERKTGMQISEKI